ncbi:ATP-binding cassette domain-containing protein [Pseudomonas parakoreensis]
MSKPILELKDLDVFYGPIQALKGVSLEINEGETVSLIGSNGAGKSTLLMSIFGQPRAAGGQILYQGIDITHKSSHYIASNGIAQSPEGRRVFPDMTVEENLLMGTIPIGDKYAKRTCSACSNCSAARRAPHSAGDDHVRRRTANARHCPRLDESAEAVVA